jgi:methylmalonyl-CoA mutase
MRTDFTKIALSTGRQPVPPCDNNPVFETGDHVTLESLYGPEQVAALDHIDQVSGFAPYMRGPYATMYRRRLWTIRQDRRFSSVEETNQYWKTIVARGTRGLALSFDRVTHKGYDSDFSGVATADIGRGGVAFDSLADMRLLFEGIALDKVSISFVMNSAALPIMAYYIVLAQDSGVALGRLTGTLQNDILGELITERNQIYPPHASMRIVTDILRYTQQHLPKFHPLCISGHPLREAGASIDMELACALASGVAYIKAAADAGIDIDHFASRVAFSWGVGMNMLGETAKLRAARLLWAKILKTLGVRDSRLLALKAHSQTLMSGLSPNSPINNVVRTTVEALAAVMGQTQSLYTSAMDVWTGESQEEAARIAENTQLFLANEATLTGPVDQLGGSYCIEKLTYDIASRAYAYMQEIESVGGMVKAIDLGLARARLNEAAMRRQARADAGLDVVVGRERYEDLGSATEHYRTENSEAVRLRQIEKIKDLKRQRNPQELNSALRHLKESALRPDHNLLEVAVRAAQAGATLGEMTAALEEVYGRFKPVVRPVLGVESAQIGSDDSFVKARAMAHEFARQSGRRPRIFLAKLGQEGFDRLMKGIALTYANLGFDVDMGPLFVNPASLVRQAVENDVHVIGVSFLSSEDQKLVDALIQELKRIAREDILVVAGGVVAPHECQHLLDAGVIAVFGPGTVMSECAQEVLAVMLEQLKEE